LVELCVDLLVSTEQVVGNMAVAEMTQTVKVVIDGNLLVMEHAQENWQKKLDDDRAISKWGC
jgi:hypothetical protein